MCILHKVTHTFLYIFDVYTTLKLCYNFRIMEGGAFYGDVRRTKKLSVFLQKTKAKARPVGYANSGL